MSAWGGGARRAGGVASPVCRRVRVECPGGTRLSGIAWVWFGVSAPVRLYDVRALEAVAARKASGRHTLLNATQLKRAAHQLGERIAGSRPKLIQRAPTHRRRMTARAVKPSWEDVKPYWEDVKPRPIRHRELTPTTTPRKTTPRTTPTQHSLTHRKHPSRANARIRTLQKP